MIEMKKGILLLVSILFSNCSKDESVLLSDYALTAEDQAAALKVHNDARAEVGVAPLQWSEELSQSAAEWAQYLADNEAFKHAGNEVRNGQGENLYKHSQTITDVGGRYAALAWYEEINLYTYSPIGSGANNFSAIGHYTQMIWETTTEVGMALAVSESGATYVVARYNPQGNITGQTPY